MAAAKKPRKIKDLKARLGRTITPETKGDGDATVQPPGGAAAPAEAKPKAAVPPPGGIVPPPAAAKPAAPGGIVAPPFAQKEEPKAATPSQAPADPFAAAQPAAGGPQEVRLVFDDSAVDDAEVGRKKKGRTMLVLGMGLFLGMLLGYGGGSVMNDRKTYNNAVRDGKDLYEAIRESSNTIEEAQRLVDQAVTAARGGPGKAPSVDYEAMEALRGLEKPFEANVFSRKNYFLFEPQTVDSMFEYYNNINLIFSKIEGLVASTSGDERREELNDAAEAAGEASALTGCLVQIVENRFTCSLGYVTIPEDGDGSIELRPSRRSRRSASKQLYTGGDLAEADGEQVILINTERSMGVLGEQASLFAEYVRDVGQVKALLDSTMEIQGRLENSLGEIAAKEEVFAF